MSVIIVSSVVPGESPIESEAYRVQPLRCEDDHSYGRGLAALWTTSATVVNVEHDMEFSDALVADLLACPEPLCSHAYQVWPSAWRRFVYAHSKDGRWLEQGDSSADFSSIGFCKLAPAGRTGELKTYPWRYVEQAVNTAVAGEWHIHWPAIKHHHDYKEPETPWQSLLRKLALEPDPLYS